MASYQPQFQPQFQQPQLREEKGKTAGVVAGLIVALVVFTALGLVGYWVYKTYLEKDDGGASKPANDSGSAAKNEAKNGDTASAANKTASGSEKADGNKNKAGGSNNAGANAGNTASSANGAGAAAGGTPQNSFVLASLYHPKTSESTAANCVNNLTREQALQQCFDDSTCTGFWRYSGIGQFPSGGRTCFKQSFAGAWPKTDFFRTNPGEFQVRCPPGSYANVGAVHPDPNLNPVESLTGANETATNPSGCQNTASLAAAEALCNANEQCTGFWRYDTGRTCFKRGSHIEPYREMKGGKYYIKCKQQQQ